MTNNEENSVSEVLQGKRLTFLGRLASMTKREATKLVRQHGAKVVDKPDAKVHLVVIGEYGLPLLDEEPLEETFDEATRSALEAGTLQVISETQLWQELGLVDSEREVHQFYTPAMLAELLGVPVAIIRRWHRRGLIVPAHEVRRLPYFDFQEVATARRLAELLAAGVSPDAIEKELELLAHYLPGVERPLAQLATIVEGKRLLLRQGDGLTESGGQLRFNFDAPPPPPSDESPNTPAQKTLAEELQADVQKLITSPEAMLQAAAELEEEGRLQEAIEMYHAAMAAGGPTPEICFQTAELLYRQSDYAGARERYYMAIELDEDYVEARANLGCVLAEQGQYQLAIAAFEGALAYHGDYADAHYHLARALDDIGRSDEAEAHWQTFLELASTSPWAEEARRRLQLEESSSTHQDE